METKLLRISVDIGGTFTDIALLDEQRDKVSFLKVPSTVDDQSIGAMEGITKILEREGYTFAELREISHATTVAANAMIERKGVEVGLITTSGFRDVPFIGRQRRYDTYNLKLNKAEPPVKRANIFEISERIDSSGNVVKPIQFQELKDICQRIQARGLTSVAVCLINSYVKPVHELEIGKALAEMLPGTFVTLSCRLSPKVREYERVITTLSNAYVQPLMEHYLARLEEKLCKAGCTAPLRIMQSNGGLVSSALTRIFPIRAVESGPAAGVLRCAQTGRDEEEGNLLTFDMGGTTAKLGAVDEGEVSISPTFEIDTVHSKRHSGLPLNISAVDLLEIGAGGGSIAEINMGLLKVGPESAGAWPGPACYSRGGDKPTVTDANVVLGYINPKSFNAGESQLDAEASRQAIKKYIADPLGLTVAEAALGIHQMANSNMERALRVVSEEHGRNPKDYTLVALGGAGPLHANSLAAAVGIDKIYIPFGAGVGSAYGLLHADTKVDVSSTRRMNLKTLESHEIQAIFESLEVLAGSELEALGDLAEIESLEWSHFVFARYIGQGFELRVQIDSEDGNAIGREEVRRRFEAKYKTVYGFIPEAGEIEIIDWNLVGVIKNQNPSTPAARSTNANATSATAVVGERKMFLATTGAFVDAPVISRELMAPGEKYSGPCLIEEAETTTVVLSGYECSRSVRGHVIIEKE